MKIRRLIIECDGFAFHSTRSAWLRDRRLDEVFRRLGYVVLRLVWEDLLVPGRVAELVRARLAEADRLPVS